MRLLCRHRLVVSLLLAVGLAATACSSTKTITSASPPPDSSADTVADTVVDTVPVTTPLPTDPPATDPPTTTPPPPDFFLLVDGIGPLTFGAGQGDVLAALDERLGATTTDEFLDFPIDSGAGFFENADGELGFLFRTARRSCYANEFCVIFGGATADSAVFVGWSFRGSEAPDALTTPEGITLGSRQSDFLGDMTVFEGGCFTVGGGESTDGIFLTLVSELTPFLEFDDLGNPITRIPDPTEITVVAMESGAQVLDLFGDC